MQVISKKTSVKYGGKWYWANQPFSIDTDTIPKGYENVLEVYGEGSTDGKVNDGLLKKETVKKPRKRTTPKKKTTKDNLQDEVLNDLDRLLSE